MEPSADDVRRQLDRLLASAVFANAARMSRFLKFVVEQTLAGEGARLKEYVIGVEVFDRDADYDPRLDAIVRVEAARLRTKLAEYYAGDGRSDAVVLSLPKGGYAGLIRLANPPLAAPNDALPVAPVVVTAPRVDPPLRHLGWRRGWLPGVVLLGACALAVGAWAPWAAAPALELRVAVLPFTPDPGDAGVESEAVAMRLTEGVTAELVRTDRFAVVASSAARAASTAGRLRDVAAALEADVLVEARVIAEGDHVRIEARAVSGDREEKFWVDSFAGPVDDTDAGTQGCGSRRLRPRRHASPRLGADEHPHPA